MKGGNDDNHHAQMCMSTQCCSELWGFYGWSKYDSMFSSYSLLLAINLDEESKEKKVNENIHKL